MRTHAGVSALRAPARGTPRGAHLHEARGVVALPRGEAVRPVGVRRARDGRVQLLIPRVVVHHVLRRIWRARVRRASTAHAVARAAARRAPCRFFVAATGTTMPWPATPPALTSASPVVFTAGAVSSTRPLSSAGASSSLPYAASASIARERAARSARRACQRPRRTQHPGPRPRATRTLCVATRNATRRQERWRAWGMCACATR